MPDQLGLYKLLSKILLGFTIMMIGFMMAFFIIHSYNKNISITEKAELKLLSSIVKTLALQIDGDAHQALVCSKLEKDAILKNDQNQTYEQIFNILKKAQIANQLETPIYTLFKQSTCQSSVLPEKNLLFGVFSNQPYFRHVYEHVPDMLFQNYEEGGIINNYEDENGHWISAFHPIKNSEGKTIAVLQADRPFQNFIAAARTELYNESIFALLFLGILVIVFVVVYQMILRSMSKINMTLEEAVIERTKKININNLELKQLNEKLEKRVEDRTHEIKERNEQLSLSNEKLKAFAHVASHDLQAPIRIIKSFGDLLKTRHGDEIGAEGKEFLDYITDNALKMSNLIKDILNTSLLPSERSIKITNIDLNEVIREVKGNLKNDIESFQAQINYSNLPSLFGFQSDFIQLFQNFISNSIKYSRHDVIPKINIEGEKEQDSFIIKIRDNGKGISEKALETILIEFDRGDVSDNKGYGIGLATCQRIIKGYDGNLKISSELGVGTCFTITIKEKSIKMNTNKSKAILGLI